MDERTKKIIALLNEKYPSATHMLEFGSTYQLLVAVMLSAQCTDKRVNIVTKQLFENYGTPQKMLMLSYLELCEIIKPCGLFHSKAKHILEATKTIIEEYNGEVPNTVEKLSKLSGVGRKTALVVYAVGFNGNAFPVDTHVFRVSRRLGLSNGKNPLQVEKQLCSIIDENLWSKCHHYLIFHGRNVCKAQNPDCKNCNLSDLCKKVGVK